MAQSKSAAYDYLIKLLLIGDSGKKLFELTLYVLQISIRLEKFAICFCKEL